MDRAFMINTGVSVPMESIINAQNDEPILDNPFTRFNQSIQDYPQDHANVNNVSLYKTDNLERMKPLMPKKGSYVGTTTLLPTQDTDEKLIFYDT